MGKLRPSLFALLMSFASMHTLSLFPTKFYRPLIRVFNYFYISTQINSINPLLQKLLSKAITTKPNLRIHLC